MFYLYVFMKKSLMFWLIIYKNIILGVSDVINDYIIMLWWFYIKLIVS